MADSEPIAETQSDTQTTYDPTAEEIAPDDRNMESSQISESQDFQLVDSGETLKETQDEMESVASKDIEKSAEVSSDVSRESSQPTKGGSESKSEDSTTEKSEEIDKVDAHEKKECATAEDDPMKSEETKKVATSEDTEGEKKKELRREEEEDDDDIDFIQSSQVETLSPLKKQISNLTGIASQKRKAENAEESLAKYPRTCSQEDALSNARKRLDDEFENIFEDEKKGERNEEETTSGTMIQETPETHEIIESESLQQVERELEGVLSQHPVEEADKRDLDSDKADESEKEKGETETESSVEEKERSEGEKLEEASGEFEIVRSIVREQDEASQLPGDSKIEEVTGEDTERSEDPEKAASADGTKEKSIQDIVGIPSASKNKDEESASADRRMVEHCFAAPTSTSRSRMSIEVIYDKAKAPPLKKKPLELVEIDEDGAKIVLDSSHESCDASLENSPDAKAIDTSYKTCRSTDYKSIDSSKDSSGAERKPAHSLSNGSGDSKVRSSDISASARSDSLTTDFGSDRKTPTTSNSSKKVPSGSCNVSDSREIVITSDSEESLVVEERVRVKEPSPTVKAQPIEKELNILVKLKCLVYVDETTKEQVEKIITGVHCESAGPDFPTLRHRNSDNSANLADISDNDKDTSPGSVTSIPNPYPLNPRLSIASTSSSSSAGSLNSKSSGIKFQLPRGPAKHAKKIVVSESAGVEKRFENEDALDQIKREWKNVDTVTCAIMNFASQELTSSDQHNGSALRADNSLERIRSSTPEVEVKDDKIIEATTPKRGAKRSRGSASMAGKITRAKHLLSSESNGLSSSSPVSGVDKNVAGSSRKRKLSPVTTPYRGIAKSDDNNDTTSTNDENEELVGTQVFAKWSDNKYYPGTVTEKTKTKYRVNFYDGQSKLIIEDFIVPMPITLDPGLSVYATSSADNYGCSGIILEVKKLRDSVVYVVETDDGERIEVGIKNIFLTNDQVQVLKEEAKLERQSPPSTPKHLGEVTLDNVIDGKRRSKRVMTPATATPKEKRGRTSPTSTMLDQGKPSVSGTSLAVKFRDTYETNSDSNFSENEDFSDGLGVQEEIIGTYNEQESKGQQSAIKGKGRGRKKSETPEVISNLGPLPAQNSDLFKNMSFLLSCVAFETIERFQVPEVYKEPRDSSSDPSTENEEEWTRKPFVRDRLIAQLTAGGGKVYETFESIPPEEYKNTKHITNIPNTTRKSLLCLSVGIKSYNHKWVIRCCQQNKIVHPSEEQLPAGWSILKRCYVDMFQRRNTKPFQTLPIIVVIPVTPGNKEFVAFWQKICENAGGIVLLIENEDEEFIEGTVVLTNRQCPTWIIKKASNWKIPLVSTAWVTQCLIEGDICDDDAHPTFKYNYVKKAASHISQLKRR